MKSWKRILIIILGVTVLTIGIWYIGEQREREHQEYKDEIERLERDVEQLKCESEALTRCLIEEQKRGNRLNDSISELRKEQLNLYRRYEKKIRAINDNDIDGDIEFLSERLSEIQGS